MDNNQANMAMNSIDRNTSCCCCIPIRIAAIIFTVFFMVDLVVAIIALVQIINGLTSGVPAESLKTSASSIYVLNIYTFLRSIGGDGGDGDSIATWITIMFYVGMVIFFISILIMLYAFSSMFRLARGNKSTWSRQKAARAHALYILMAFLNCAFALVFIFTIPFDAIQSMTASDTSSR